MIKRLKPYLGVGLAAWVASAGVLAQGDFYIELRGPESADRAPAREPDRPSAAPRAVQQISPAPATRPIQQIATGQPATPGRYGPVRSTDTLWTIAEKYTRSPVTVQQTMVALYHLNPRSFVRGNINNLQRGAQLRIPTDSQARQRSAAEAQAEFSRLTRQGNRRVVQGAVPAATKPQIAAVPPAAQPVANTPAPTAARPPVTEPKPLVNGLTEPKAAAPIAAMAPATPVITPAVTPEATAATAPATPAAAEETALSRLQLQLMDELREQVSMSNEQLASLADNNQALRQHLAQLTAEVAALKADVDERGPLAEVAAAPEPNAESKHMAWVQEVLNNPINLALILILPALLLLALFTLWWRKRERRDIAAQEQALTETSIMLDDDRDEFDDLFTTSAADDLEAAAFASEAPIAEQDIDEDAFARFLEEQQQLEEAEAERQVAAVVPEPELLFEPEVISEPEPELAREPDEDPLFEDNFAEDIGEEALAEDPLFEDQLFEDMMFDESASNSADTLSNDELDDLFNMSAMTDDISLSDDEIAQSLDAEAAAQAEADALAEAQAQAQAAAQADAAAVAQAEADAAALAQAQAAAQAEADAVAQAQAQAAAQAEADAVAQAQAQAVAQAEADAAAQAEAQAAAQAEADAAAQTQAQAAAQAEADAAAQAQAQAVAQAEADALAEAQAAARAESAAKPLTAAGADSDLGRQEAPPARLMDDWPEPLVESMAAMEAELGLESEFGLEPELGLGPELTAEAEPKAPEPYVSVDELMADAERGEGPDPDRERNLDLELDEYANVIGQGQGVDIDIDEGGMSGQLDLARAYIEIDDIDSARDLLNEALERGNAEQQRDAKKLLQRLDKRG